MIFSPLISNTISCLAVLSFSSLTASGNHDSTSTQNVEIQLTNDGLKFVDEILRGKLIDRIQVGAVTG